MEKVNKDWNKKKNESKCSLETIGYWLLVLLYFELVQAWVRRSARSKLKTSLIHSAVHQNAIYDLIITKHMLGDM